MNKEKSFDEVLETKDAGEIRQNLSKQQIELDRLTKTIEDLKKYLHPILGPEEEIGETAELEKAPLTSIGSAINENTKTLCSEIRELREIIERIEI